jgi:hypothetical protein
MEKYIGRASFQSGRIKFNDSEASLERKLYPNADPGDPDAGERIDDEALTVLIEAAKQLRELSFDDEGTISNESLKVLVEAAKRLRALSFTDPPVEAATPMETFKKASDKRWDIGQQTPDAIDTSSAPMERFKASSKRRWGF